MGQSVLQHSEKQTYDNNTNNTNNTNGCPLTKHTNKAPKGNPPSNYVCDACYAVSAQHKGHRVTLPPYHHNTMPQHILVHAYVCNYCSKKSGQAWVWVVKILTHRSFVCYLSLFCLQSVLLVAVLCSSGSASWFPACCHRLRCWVWKYANFLSRRVKFNLIFINSFRFYLWKQFSFRHNLHKWNRLDVHYFTCWFERWLSQANCCMQHVSLITKKPGLQT